MELAKEKQRSINDGANYNSCIMQKFKLYGTRSDTYIFYSPLIHLTIAYNCLSVYYLPPDMGRNSLCIRVAAALRVLFSSMNSPSQLGWPANGDDPCVQHWKGITCSGNRVTEIKLPGLGLAGTLGYQLQTLTSVTNLNLANHNFTGEVVYSISDMTALTYLNLGHNQLQGALSVNFVKLSSLSTLDLSFNSLSGELPLSFTSLSSITTMYLQNNQFTGTIDVLAGLPLATLNVQNNHFTGWIPEQLKKNKPTEGW